MRVLLLSGIIILCDQLTKLMVKGIHVPALGINWEGMPYGSSKPILGDFFRLTYIENPGMAFGIDVGGKLYFSVFSILASVAIVYYLYRTRNERLGFRIAEVPVTWRNDAATRVRTLQGARAFADLLRIRGHSAFGHYPSLVCPLDNAIPLLLCVALHIPPA